MRGYFDTRLLPEGLRATGHSVDGAVLTIDAEVLAAEVICPGCGQGSTRRHGRYVRHLTDFPAHGRSVQVRLSVRRFRCVASHCPTTTFSEQVPDCLACRYGRRTGRFQDLVAYLGRAMGGRPAQALGRRMRIGVSKDTFLRSAATGARTMEFEPRVIGIDDWAWRKCPSSNNLGPGMLSWSGGSGSYCSSLGRLSSVEQATLADGVGLDPPSFG